MSLIEGLGDEVTSLIVIVLTSIIVFLAWRSTHVRDILVSPTAVLIIENRRRLLNRINQHPVTISILRSSSRQSNQSNATEELELEQDMADDLNFSETSTMSILENENSDLVYDNNARLVTQTENIINSLEEAGQRELLREMDDMSDNLQRRRTNSQRNEILDSIPIQNDTSDISTIENCTNENNENVNISEGREMQDSSSELPAKTSTAEGCEKNDMLIKLKYLNDDLRMVQGQPNEPIGDFKKRNFSVELAANKLVRLVFNGHVLQPDSKTLKACGLFDNCVVHCLIHNRKSNGANINNENTHNHNENDNASSHNQNENEDNPENIENVPMFVYIVLFILSLVLISYWFCRFQYGYLFSWFSTTGLVLLTTLFLIMIPLIILMEREVTT